MLDQERKTILLVEDEVIIAMATSRKIKDFGYDLPNVKFLPIQDIPKSCYNAGSKEEKFVESFVDKYLWEMRLKEQYSPTFRLPYEKIDKVQEFKDKMIVNEKFNMLKFLVIDKMGKKK